MNKMSFLKDLRIIEALVAKNSPAILLVVGIGGLATAGFLAHKATSEAEDILEDLHEEQLNNEEEYSKPEQIVKDVKAVGYLYGPAIIVGGVSLACLVGSYSINSKRLAALATAYGLSERSFRDYRRKVVDTLGEAKEAKIRSEIAKDRVEADPQSEKLNVINIESGDQLCYDSQFGRYFSSNINKIRKIEFQLNKRLMNEMYISVNEYFDEVGLSPTKIGNDLGWNIDHPISFDFNSILTANDTTCLVVDYDLDTRYDFRSLH